MRLMPIAFLLVLCFSGCAQVRENPGQVQPIVKDGNEKEQELFLGADLSYVNEMEDCGGVYRKDGVQQDPYLIFKEKGCQIARFRLWHTPDWTLYSTFSDVKKSIRRAKMAGMKVLLDFHYSDTWTDPSRQLIPNVWSNISSQEILGDSLFQYTRSVLLALDKEGILPDLVQVGNEINAEILQKTEPSVFPIQWTRNSFLLNKGIAAVRSVSKTTGKSIGVLLHIAQPDEVFNWLKEATENKVLDFDWVGLSYYSQWSRFNLIQLRDEIARIRKAFGKRVMVVETGYPFTLRNADAANNLLDTVSQLPGYTINAAEQKRFMTDLTQAVLDGGGEGVIYWEPAWISTSCSTRWAKGSHWDNATFFDFQNENEALPVFDFFNSTQYKR